MIGQAISLKRFFTWRQLLGNARAMKRARKPIRGFVTTISFWAIQEIGFLDELEAGRRVSIKTFAQSNQLDADILLAICLYLKRLGYLTIDGDQVKLSRNGQNFWKQAFSVFHLFEAYEPLWTSLVAQLRGQLTFGKDLFRREAQVARGFDELGQQFLFPMMLGLIHQLKYSQVIELGCGAAKLSSFICSQDSDLRCLGIDNDANVLEQAGERIRKLGLEDRIDILLADMFEIDRTEYDFKPFQVVAAIDLFHGYYLEGEAKLISLFETLRRGFKGKDLLISEICLPDDRSIKKISYPLAEHELFHDLSNQKSFLPGELESILERSGYHIKQRWNFNEIAGRVCLHITNP